MESKIDNTIVIIPSFNEAKSIGEVVRNTTELGLSALVIDDGSIDNTQRIALDNGAMVVGHRQNLGKGYSVRQGIEYVAKKTNFEWIVIMDGDGQHHPLDIKSLMDATRSSDVEMVSGNRMFQTQEMPPVRVLTNKFMSWVISGMCRQHIPDTQCGFRLIKVSALKKMKLVSTKYDIESEMLIQAAKNGIKIESAPIRTIYGEEVSKIKPLRDTMRFIALITRFYFSGKKT